MANRGWHRRDTAVAPLLVAGALSAAELTGLSTVVGLDPAGWVAGVLCAVGGAVIVTAAAHRADRYRFGPADWVTLTRTVLVGGVGALVADTLTGDPNALAVVVVGGTALVLDAVDGRVARHTATASAFGARFDMETDAFLILVLSTCVAPEVGWWVLAIGVMRYAFVLVGRFLPWLRGSLPPSMARKVVAATQGIVLLAAVSGALPRWLAGTATGLALAALTWSFGRDVRWLYGTRIRTRRRASRREARR